MGLRGSLGGCLPLLAAAAALDAVGLVLLFVGIFANLRIDGRFYGDFLIYSGALVVFLSLGFWLMWYVGNVQVSADGASQRGSVVAVLAGKLSERLSRKASRVTWGQPAAYNNEGYEGSLDPPAGGKVEAEPGGKHRV